MEKKQIKTEWDYFVEKAKKELMKLGLTEDEAEEEAVNFVEEWENK